MRQGTLLYEVLFLWSSIIFLSCQPTCIYGSYATEYFSSVSSFKTLYVVAELAENIVGCSSVNELDP